MLREKRENTEKFLDQKNTGPTTESVEERKKRLQA
jgi:hypothetical protein